MTADQQAIWTGVFAGIWGLAMLAIFIMAIRLSYAIERRSAGLENTSGVPRNAMMFHTIFNLDVARDPETQAMRRRMIKLLIINLAGFVSMFAYVVSLRGS
jgi:hypothetical protein